MDNAMVPKEFSEYMENGFDNIPGWPGRKLSVVFMGALKALFDLHGETGGACEIGVHHCKYLIALHNLLLPKSSLAIDLFDDQTKNIDGSGSGSLSACRENIQKYAANPDSIELRSMDSLNMNQKIIDEIIEKHGRFALFSVDGGHTPLHASVDFMTASKLTSQYGMIIVDDLFHPDWPGVTEGIYTALSLRQSPFVPLFITRKKAVFCHLSVVKEYQPVVDQAYRNLSLWHLMHVNFFGWPVLSLNFGGEY